MEKDNFLGIKIIFLFTTIFLLALSIFSYIRINSLVAASGMVNHTNLVKLELETVFSDLKDIESGQRGYIITKDSAFLDHFNIALNDIDFHLDNFNSLTTDNPFQQQNLVALRTLVDKRIAYLKHILNDANTEKITVNRLIGSNIIMNDVRAQVVKMTKEEDQLLIKRSTSFDKENLLKPIVAILLAVTFIVVILVSYFKLIQQLKITMSLKADLESKTKKIDEHNITLQQKNRDLLKMNEELESFTYISSHDLQEPLRKIQTFADKILRSEYQNLSQDGLHSFTRIEESANRMQMLIQDLMAYSRTRVGEFHFENVDINEILDEVRTDLHQNILEKNAIIEDTGLCKVMIIRSQFRQLLHNLISNALKFSNPLIAVHVIISSKIVNSSELNNEAFASGKDYCHLTFTDNGIGFDPLYKDLIFKVFQRLHRKDQYEGSGIGLAIVKKIVENHHGFITANSQINRGATFEIFIPML